MSKFHILLVFVILTLCIFSAGCLLPFDGSVQDPKLLGPNISVPVAPIPVSSLDGANLAYELEISSAGNQKFTPEKLEVIDPSTGNILWTIDGDLLAALSHPASDPLPTEKERQTGTGKLSIPRISIWFTVSEDAIPDQLTHRITFGQAGKDPVIVTGGTVDVRKDLQPVVIGSPFRGAGWLAMETTSPMTHHFLAQITMDSVTRVPQKYAQDWIYVDPKTGKAVNGNSTLARDYLGYGKEIYAVSSGTVVDLLDGLPDVECVYSAGTPSIETAAGNYVIIDMGNEKYACYAHMIPGSIRVSLGDTVFEGQILGLMGNSGNSDIPHLHFQIVTGKASFLGAEEYPHVYRSFDVIGQVNGDMATQRQEKIPGYTFDRLFAEFSDFVTIHQDPVRRQNELPENWDIVSFP